MAPPFYLADKDYGRRDAVPKRTVGSSVPVKQCRRTRAVLSESDTFIRIARRQIYKSWKQVVQGLIDQAIKGGYQHTKMLLELCGVTGQSGKNVLVKKKMSLSDRLLQGLEFYVDERDKGKDRNHDKGNTQQNGQAKHTNGE